MATDKEIKRAILEALKQGSDLSPHTIEVQVQHQQVTLSGTVDTYTRKRDAEHAVYRVPSVKQVINRIEVHRPGVVDHTDAEIARAARVALGGDAFIPGDQIVISVERGWVTLQGEVTYGFQKTDAERDVAYLDGVQGITNLLTMKPAGQVISQPML